MLARGWAGKAGIIAPRRPEEARGLFGLALEVALAHDMRGLLGAIYSNISDLALQRDRYADSLAQLEQLVEYSRRAGIRRNEWFGLSEMTYPLTMLGRWQEALDRLAEIPEDVIGRTSTLSSPLSGPLEIFLQRGSSIGRACS